MVFLYSGITAQAITPILFPVATVSGISVLPVSEIAKAIRRQSGGLVPGNVLLVSHHETIYSASMSVQALDRTFDLLELLARFPEGLALTDIADKIGLHKSTVHRLLGSLKDRGYIAQDSESSRYSLGLGFISLAGPYLNQLDMKTIAEPEMRRLSDSLGVTIYMGTLRDDEVVYLDKVERYDGFRRFDIIGRHVPIHCTSLGKSLVMDMEDSVLRELLNQKALVKKTPKTITGTDGVLENVAMCRKRGWSSDLEEHEEGVNCVGAPVRDHRGRIVAAISAVWRSSRTDGEIGDAGKGIAETASEISRLLGHLSD